nr:putative membrane protein [Cedratvirus duvanny]
MTTFTRKHVWYQSFSLVNKGIQSRKGHIRYQSSSLLSPKVSKVEKVIFVFSLVSKGYLFLSSLTVYEHNKGKIDPL